MYLVGTFERSSIFTENPLNLVFIVDTVTRDHLIKAKQSEDYQVINVLEKTYFDPEANTWRKLNEV